MHRITDARAAVMNGSFRPLEEDFLGDRFQAMERTRTIKVPFAATGDDDADSDIVVGLANPEGARILVTEVVIDITTGDADGQLDIGIGASGAVETDFFSNLAATAGVSRWVAQQAGSSDNAVAVVEWASTTYFTVAAEAAAIAGLVGNAYITYLVP